MRQASVSRLMVSLLIAVTAAVGLPGRGIGTTYLLQPDGSGDFPTIQEAVDAAVEGDTILLANGAYTGITHPGITLWGKDLVIKSASGDRDSVVVGNIGSYSFNISQHETRATVIADLTVAHASGSMGAGFHIRQSEPTIRNCVVRDCWGHPGGGVGIDDGAEPLFEYCHIYNNTVNDLDGSGGGVYFSGQSKPMFHDCLIENNIAGQPGFGGAGGGVSGLGGGELVNCIIRNNTTGGIGGALRVSGRMAIRDCLIYGNEAAIRGGGLHYSTYFGGMIEISGSTIVGNSAPEAAGIYHGFLGGDRPANMVISDTIIAFNTGGPAIDCGHPAWNIFISCTDIFGNPGGDWVLGYADQLGQDGNISLDPLFCDLEGGTLTLYDQSPCLPANNTCGVLMGVYDQGCVVTAAPTNAAPLLAGSHPNPFNGATRIVFSLPEAAPVSLQLYDLRGRLVRTLLDAAPREAGEHGIFWRGTDDAGRPQPSGLYLYRLETPQAAVSDKIALIK